MKLLLIDGNAVLHRAYYAMPDWRNRSGEATAGVYGFLSMLLKALDELKPTSLVVVFDTPEPTFRHLMYVGYQHNREKDRQISEDIWGQVEKLKIVFGKMKVPVFSVEGFEADDVIGTICKLSINNVPSSPPLNIRGGDVVDKVIIITGDRDLMQLVNENVNLYMPQKGLSDAVIVDEEKVVERMGVKPNQIVDYKGLVGDSSDNYPGVAGIGPKTAIDLLKEFGSLDNIYEQISKSQAPISKIQINSNFQITKTTLEKLIKGYEAAKLSQILATIKTDVPVNFDRTQCAVPSTQEIADILKELGYKSLVKRASGEVIKIDENQQKLFE